MYDLSPSQQAFFSLETSNLGKYEILVNQRLHDILNNIKNIDQESPHHVRKDHSLNKRKDSLQARAALLIFLLKLKFLWCPYSEYIKTANK